MNTALSYNNKYCRLFLRRILRKLGLIFFRRSLVFVHLELNDNSYGDQYHGFNLASVQKEETESNYNDGWFGTDNAIKLIREGHSFFLSRENGRIFCFTWHERKANIAWLNMELCLPDDTIYLTMAYTPSEFRGREYAKKIRNELFNRLKKEGIRHIIGNVDPVDTVALNIYDNLGFRQYQLIRYNRYSFLRHYRVFKSDSNQEKSFFTMSKPPESIWKIFY